MRLADLAYHLFGTTQLVQKSHSSTDERLGSKTGHDQIIELYIKFKTSMEGWRPHSGGPRYILMHHPNLPDWRPPSHALETSLVV